jgi:hypothetical protein
MSILLSKCWPIPYRAAIPTPGARRWLPGQGLLILLNLASRASFVCRTPRDFSAPRSAFWSTGVRVLELQRNPLRCSFAADHRECHAHRSSEVRPSGTGHEKLRVRSGDIERRHRDLCGRDRLLCRLRAKKPKSGRSRESGSTTGAALFRLRLDNVWRALPRSTAQPPAMSAERGTPALAIGVLAAAISSARQRASTIIRTLAPVA